MYRGQCTTFVHHVTRVSVRLYVASPTNVCANDTHYAHVHIIQVLFLFQTSYSSSREGDICDQLIFEFLNSKFELSFPRPLPSPCLDTSGWRILVRDSG